MTNKAKWNCNLIYDGGNAILKIGNTITNDNITISISKNWTEVDIDKTTIQRLVLDLEKNMGTKLAQCFNFLKY